MAHMSYSTLNVEFTGYDPVVNHKDLQHHHGQGFQGECLRENPRRRINSRRTTQRQKANISFCCSAPKAYPTMSNHTDEDPMDQDSCTSTSDEANFQLDRELRQSGEVTRTTTEPSQQTIPVGISPAYAKGWDTTDAFRELYQNWYVTFISIG